MLFISIPLLFIGVSLIAILALLLRRFPATAGLRPGEINGGIWKSFFPELDAEVKKIHFRPTLHTGLVELEKIIRKLRLFIVATERLFDSMIHRIRRVQNRQTVKQEMLKETAPVETVPIITEPEIDPVQKLKDVGISNVHVKEKVELAVDEKLKLKSRETELIDAIALNPKDTVLYSELGDIYIKLENWTDARESLQTALRLNRNDEALALKLSQALQNLLGRNK